MLQRKVDKQNKLNAAVGLTSHLRSTTSTLGSGVRWSKPRTSRPGRLEGYPRQIRSRAPPTAPPRSGGCLSGILLLPAACISERHYGSMDGPNLTIIWDLADVHLGHFRTKYLCDVPEFSTALLSLGREEDT